MSTRYGLGINKIPVMAVKKLSRAECDKCGLSEPGCFWKHQCTVTITPRKNLPLLREKNDREP